MLHKNNNPSLSELFRADPERGRHFRWREAGWVLDYSGLPLSPDGRASLLRQARDAGLANAISRLFGGAIVNPSENRPALHMALRAADPAAIPGSDPDGVLKAQREAFLEQAGRIHDGRQGLTDLLHIGIGGSDLGPRLVADALDAGDSAVRVHWLATLDGRRYQRLVRELDPARTGVMIASKSFSTEETLTQAHAVRQWLGAGFADRAWAATACPDRALAFGLAPSAILSFPDWVGGRYSLWSSVGFSAAAVIGPERFGQLLAGAAEADAAFSSPAATGSLAQWLALLMHFLRRDLACPTLGVIAYEPRLALLGDYLQQLFMESLGKGVDLSDRPLEQPTSPLIFGGRGTDLQHSIFQALHQGLDSHPLLLVGSLSDAQGDPAWHRAQLAHLLAQSAALTRGRTQGRACQQMPGERPVAVLLSETVGPENLGYLLASFEHAVFALSVLWGINPFDQWGVEEGKRLAGQFSESLPPRPDDVDDVLDLLARVRAGD
jgi:glucose-6-phosphate isomerase